MTSELLAKKEEFEPPQEKVSSYVLQPQFVEEYKHTMFDESYLSNHKKQ